MTPSSILPPNTAIVDARGYITTPWYRFLLSLVRFSNGLEDLTEEVRLLATAGDASSGDGVSANALELFSVPIAIPESPDFFGLPIATLETGAGLVERNGKIEFASTTGSGAVVLAQAPALSSPTISGIGGNLFSSSYTPTITLVANMDAAAVAGAWQYTRIGNRVMGGGYINCDPTAAGTAVFEATLPVASNFATATDAMGNATGRGISGFVYSSAANDRLVIDYTAINGTAHSLCAMFSYDVI